MASMGAAGEVQPAVGEVLPKKGLLFTESQSQVVLCQPKLLPLKSFTLQKLEAMQNQAKVKAHAQLRPEESDEAANGEDGTPAFVSESMSFE